MLIHAGTEISRLSRDIRRALATAEDILVNKGQEVIVVSTYEGKHRAGSLHYAHQAVDIRKPNPEIQEFFHTLIGRLPNDYHVESQGGCYHIEYNPPERPKRC